MPLYFITGNKNKFEEVQAIIHTVQQLDIDLPEIQDVDGKNIIRAKLIEALKHDTGTCIVEDTSLYLDCLNGLPGPLIKWFLKTIGNNGLAHLSETLHNTRAEAKTIIGYAENQNEIEFFEGSVFGTIVPERGNSDFGWDTIFLPEGSDKTFSEMTQEEKNRISMRSIAARKLHKYLLRKGVS